MSSPQSVPLWKISLVYKSKNVESPICNTADDKASLNKQISISPYLYHCERLYKSKCLVPYL